MPYYCQVQSKLRSQFLGPLCLWQCFYLWVEHRLSTSGEDLPSYFAKRLPLCLLINKKKGSPMKGMHRDIWSCIGRRRNYIFGRTFSTLLTTGPVKILALLRFVSRCFGGIDCEFVCLFFPNTAERREVVVNIKKYIPTVGWILTLFKSTFPYI